MTFVPDLRASFVANSSAAFGPAERLASHYMRALCLPPNVLTTSHGRRKADTIDGLSRLLLASSSLLLRWKAAL